MICPHLYFGDDEEEFEWGGGQSLTCGGEGAMMKCKMGKIADKRLEEDSVG